MAEERADAKGLYGLAIASGGRCANTASAMAFRRRRFGRRVLERPDVAADTLPNGIELDARRAGHSVALFADWQFTAQNDEYLAARNQCREFIVLPDATWQGAEIAWCPDAQADGR